MANSLISADCHHLSVIYQSDIWKIVFVFVAVKSVDGNDDTGFYSFNQSPQIRELGVTAGMQVFVTHI
jgi:hypothetical protein